MHAHQLSSTLLWESNKQSDWINTPPTPRGNYFQVSLSSSGYWQTSVNSPLLLDMHYLWIRWKKGQLQLLDRVIRKSRSEILFLWSAAERLGSEVFISVGCTGSASSVWLLYVNTTATTWCNTMKFSVGSVFCQSFMRCGKVSVSCTENY